MTTIEDPDHLFSYGTLQDEAVQLATFGRRLSGKLDALPGYRPGVVPIQDPTEVATDGTKYHQNAEFTGHRSDKVLGTVFQVTKLELEQADIYEATANYKRVRVELKSGTQSWVYVADLSAFS